MEQADGWIAGGEKRVEGKDVHFEVYPYRLWNDLDEYISGGTSGP
jgi:hypothetical protein